MATAQVISPSSGEEIVAVLESGDVKVPLRKKLVPLEIEAFR
jgi:hypothetical protein